MADVKRRALLVAGEGVLAVGLALSVAPGLAGFGAGDAIVTAFGVVALVQAVRIGRARKRGELTWAETPDPELAGGSPPPGEDVDDVLESVAGDAAHGLRMRTRHALGAVAVAALSAYGGWDREEARDRVERGTWTDDPYAAAYLADGRAPAASLRERLRRRLGGPSVFDRNLAHTVDAIAEVARRSSPSAVVAGDISDSDRPRTVTDVNRSARAGAGSRADGGSRVDRENRDEHETGHWLGVSAIALVCLGAGALTGTPAVLLCGVVGLGYGAFARSGPGPEPSLSVEREVSDARPDPGDEVRVTVTVRNDGAETLPDVRLVDGVPESLAVRDGSPRSGTSLRSGEEATFSYAVAARRGVHEFSPLLALTRDLAGTVERETRVGDETTITCVPRLRPTETAVPLRRQVTGYTGRVAAPTGGDGVTFHATREYRTGDPLSRVDWNRRARTGEFATLEFREERSATVALVVDATATADVAPTPDGPNAIDRGVEAAGRLYAGLSDAGNRVGVAALGDRDCWLAPGSGADHRARARELLACHPALQSRPRDERAQLAGWKRQFRRRLTGDAQLIVLSPLVDDAVARVARHLHADGYPVTVVSPDPTTDRRPGHRLAGVVRKLRITDLRRAGVRVVDWAWDEPLGVALSRYEGGRAP
ncbi:DUF58 domain-containing protein [Halosimplex sp. TS25]|uniref:DUF58 domain-containing protein n=1 Tax=Halosimplex rarum TaxID=3396619 RepID=UPI0039EC412A